MPFLIPKTTTENYITGITALNIHSPEGTGDWHTLSVFKGTHGRKPKTIVVAGFNYPSSYEWLGDSELINCREFLLNQKVSFINDNQPVWASTHYRAIVDMVLNLVKEEADIGRYIQLDDWLPQREEKNRCFALLGIINNLGGFTTEQWILVSFWMELEINREQ